MAITREKLAKLIDYTLLKPDTVVKDIIELCKEAKEYKFAAVCINPSYVSLAAGLLKKTDVKVCTVIGFPLGASITNVKAFETKNAIEDGAQEVDMVINIGALKSGNFNLVEQDVEAVVKTAKNMGNVTVKAIIEANLLTDDEKIEACKLVKKAKADFVKTCTGFWGGGATVTDVKLIRSVVGDKMGVKASGGIRTAKDALNMIRAGANRIGTSFGAAIIKEL
jgi:deoxyribose-phosphate aldolase